MKQILQNLKTGNIELAEVPTPQLKEGHILVETQTSLISAGTERMLVEFGKANLLDKARQQPQRMREVVEELGGQTSTACCPNPRNMAWRLES